MGNYLLRMLNRSYEIITFSSKDGEYFASTGKFIPFSEVYIPYQKNPIIVKKNLLTDIADDLPDILYKEKLKRKSRIRKPRRDINSLILAGMAVKDLEEQGLEYKLVLIPCVVEEKLHCYICGCFG